jgi:hypothetical protein
MSESAVEYLGVNISISSEICPWTVYPIESMSEQGEVNNGQSIRRSSTHGRPEYVFP